MFSPKYALPCVAIVRVVLFFAILVCSIVLDKKTLSSVIGVPISFVCVSPNVCVVCWQQQHHVPEGEQGGPEARVRVQSMFIQRGCAVGVVRLQE